VELQGGFIPSKKIIGMGYQNVNTIMKRAEKQKEG
jgi:hypothetical protein